MSNSARHLARRRLPRRNSASGRDSRSGASGRDIVVGQDAERGAVEIVVLPVFERPHEADKPGKTEQKRERHEINGDATTPAPILEPF